MSPSKPGEFCTRCGKKCNVTERDGFKIYNCPGSEIRKNTWIGSHGEQGREKLPSPEPKVPVLGTVK